MSARREWVRFLIACWALLQFAAAPTLALIDGAIALDQASLVTAHVESHSLPTCHPPHMADCALCQLLSTHANDARPASPCVLAVRQESMGVERIIVDPAAPDTHLWLSRAPPRL